LALLFEQHSRVTTRRRLRSNQCWHHATGHAGLPKGPFTLFDNDGYIIPVFSAANLLGEDDDIFAYAGDSRLAIAHVILHGAKRDAPIDWTTQVLLLSLLQRYRAICLGPTATSHSWGSIGRSQKQMRQCHGWAPPEVSSLSRCRPGITRAEADGRRDRLPHRKHRIPLPQQPPAA